MFRLIRMTDLKRELPIDENNGDDYVPAKKPFFVQPDIHYKYDVVKWKAINSENQLQCFCATPLKKNTPGADILACSKCNFSLSMKAISACLASNAFPKWPLMQLPLCTKCCQVGIRMYVNSKKAGSTQALVFACKCEKPETNYFRTNDGNSKCWNSFIDVEAANNIKQLGVLPVDLAGPIKKEFVKPENMF